MKVYVAIKKKDGKAYRGLTVYGEKGKVLYQEATLLGGVDNIVKFLTYLEALKWAVEKVRVLMENKKLPNEPILWYISNKTVYKWLEEEASPLTYLALVSAILLEFSFYLEDVEVIHHEGVEAKVSFELKEDESYSSVLDLMN